MLQHCCSSKPTGSMRQGSPTAPRKKKEVWKEISEVLQGRGYQVNSNVCDTKMRALRKRYKTIKDNATLSGRGAMKQWQYYHVMDDLFVKKPATQPRVVEGTDPGDSDTSRATPSSSHLKPIPSPDTLQPRPASIHSAAVSSVPSPVSPHGESSCDEHGMQPPRKRARPQQQQLRSSQLLEGLTSANKERADALNSFLATYKQKQEDDKQQQQ
ncbi:hypothetical protein Pmani_029189 [Petrolisthes manimaculis]|uniref:Myb/SANT-like DNA-binding domain-containing protein n=1 Tax=Petrolisthes manimaculis TaxID=1843537 RepID=A0AAE1NZW0_9EUCA|nr:hypothetical protein Pmani_029189 [Petrolisthes manimaculis]